MKLNHDVLKGITLEQVKAAIAEINSDPKIEKAGEKVRGKRHANKAVLAECLVDGVLRLADKGFRIPEKVDELTASLMELPINPKKDLGQQILDAAIVEPSNNRFGGIEAKPGTQGKIPQQTPEKPQKPKTPKVPPVIQNGVRKPKPEGKCGQAWTIFDSLKEKNGEVIIADALTWAVEGGLNPGNVKTEFTYWKKFHGITKTK